MIQHYRRDSATSEWLNEIVNIDGTDPDASYVGGLAFNSVREYKSKDVTLGNGEHQSNDQTRLQPHRQLEV